MVLSTIAIWHIARMSSKADAINTLNCFVEVWEHENFDSIPNLIISGEARSRASVTTMYERAIKPTHS